MVDSSDKGARFIALCNAYNIPLVYLADVSGFMVGTKVERAGICPGAPGASPSYIGAAPKVELWPKARSPSDTSGAT